AFKRVLEAKVVAVASPTQAHVKAFAEKHHIARWFTDYHELLKLKEVQVVSLCLPNHLHCQATVDAAAAGKHVICEKPLCLSLPAGSSAVPAPPVCMPIAPPTSTRKRPEAMIPPF